MTKSRDGNESKNHEFLVELATKNFKEEGYEVIKYGNYMDKRIDLLLLKNDSIIGFCECVVSQILTEAMRKLEKLPEKEKYIFRFFKPRNPKASQVIKKIEEKNIKLLEVKHDSEIGLQAI